MSLLQLSTLFNIPIKNYKILVKKLLYKNWRKWALIQTNFSFHRKYKLRQKVNLQRSRWDSKNLGWKMYAPNSSLDHNMTKTLIMSQYLLVSKPSTSRDNFNFSLTLKLNKIAKWLWKIWSCVIFNKNQRISGWDMW